MAGRFSVEAIFKAVDKVTAPVSRMQNRVGKFTRSMSSGFYRLNRSVDKFSGGVKRAALAATAALAISGTAMADVIGTGAQFEQTLVAAAAKFPGEIRKGTEAFRLLEDTARRTGATTEFTASQSAEALNFLAMAGFNAEAAVAALPGVVDLATAAQVDLATATDVASDSLGAFGLMSQDAEQLGRNLARVNDVIARTTTSANTTVEALFETIKDGAPVATTAGASLETFAALAGVMANSGIKGTRAGTTLKNVFLSLSAPTAGAARILQRLGVQTQDAEGNMRDVVDILGDLNKSLDGLGTAERSGVLEGIFGKIPIAGVNVLLAEGADRLDAYRKQLEGASGASTTMATVMRDTVQGRLASLNSAIEGVKISIFTMTSGPLADVIDRMTEWTRANEQLIATKIGEFLLSVINNLDRIVFWAERIGVALGTFFALVAILKTFVLVMTAVNLVMALNPIGLIVLGVVAAIAAFSALVVWIDDVAAAFDDMNPFLRAILAPLELIVRTIKFIKDAFRGGFGEAVGKLLASIGFSEEDLAQATAADQVSAASEALQVPTVEPQMVSPQERVARSIEETRTTSAAEVTIRDETGRAEVTGGQLGPQLTLARTGGF